MDEQKIFKTLNFWFINTWNNIYQLQRSGSCIRVSEGYIWVRRIRAQILLEGHKRLCFCVCEKNVPQPPAEGLSQLARWCDWISTTNSERRARTSEALQPRVATKPRAGDYYIHSILSLVKCLKSSICMWWFLLRWKQILKVHVDSNGCSILLCVRYYSEREK